MSTAAEAAAALLGGTFYESTILHGGDLSVVEKILLADGRYAVVKRSPHASAEAEMLEAIARTGAAAPAVLAVADDLLVLGLVPAGGRLEDAWESAGRMLARLHQGSRAVRPRYGWHRNHAFGDVAVENGWRDDWPAFYAENRLLAHVAFLPSVLARRIEALVRRLPDVLPQSPPAVLLHGDFWSGNILVSGREVTAVIDPSCIFGHAEMDIAMLGLFSRPGDAFSIAYGGKELGAAERLPIYQLWPALVHLRLFGGVYRGLVDGLLTAAGV